jgi:hypothetical protein
MHKRSLKKTFYGECSSLTFLQPLCCQRISYSSSLHEGYDEPEILLDQIVKSVPKALTLDNSLLGCEELEVSFGTALSE